MGMHHKGMEVFRIMEEKKDSNNYHDPRFLQAQRNEIYQRALANRKSYMANKDVYARVPLKGMPDPEGEVYRG